MKKTLLAYTLFLFLLSNVQAQVDSIFNQSMYRNYILHLPTNYNAQQKYPLIVCFHGLNSTAAKQQVYAGFDAIADTANFIIVYPNGINNTWNLQANSTPSDINFTSALIDTIVANFSVDTNCIYATGMSMGGFMSYAVACALGNTIKAVGVVSGNMSTNLKGTCSPPKGLPIMHFHGTSDNLVSYNGAPGISTVPLTIDWWVNQNNCTTTPVTTSLPDINTTDGCTVEKNVYGNGKDNSEVVFYKVTGGGHCWPSGKSNCPFGNATFDVDASQLIWAFFKKRCSTPLSIDKLVNKSVTIYPNPATDKLLVNNNENTATLQIIDMLGNTYLQKQIINGENTIDIQTLSSGVYLVRVVGSVTINKLFIKQL